MKRLAQSIILLTASSTVMAEAIFHPAGENLGAGPVSNFQTLMSHTNNPATGATALDVDGGGFGIGLVPSFGFGWELGPVGDLTSKMEDLQVQLDGFENNPSPELANDIKAEFDDFLVEAGDKGYFQIHTGAHIVAPIVWNSKDLLGGSLVLDVNAAVQAQLSILDREILFNPLAVEVADQLQTSSAAYIKVGAVAESSLNYSMPVYRTNAGSLYAGLRGKYYQVALRKTFASVAQFSEVETLLNEEAKIETSGAEGYGIDLGVMWAATNYRVGATFKNLNAPSFEYDALGQDCENKVGAVQDSCYIARSFSDEIDMEEKWTMDPQVNLEVAAYTNSRNWFVAATADVSPVHDPVGNELQWFTASAGYTGRWKIPAGFRVGYRKNLAGSQLSAATLGLSLLKVIHLDLMWGLETVPFEAQDTPELDSLGGEVPRMAQVNLGIDFMF